MEERVAFTIPTWQRKDCYGLKKKGEETMEGMSKGDGIFAGAFIVGSFAIICAAYLAMWAASAGTALICGLQ